MIILRQSTASQEVPLGHFLDSGDGDTAEDALTIANTDIKVWKTGATSLANKNSGGATHMAGGVYYATLDATDTNTIGPLVLFVHVSGALACKVDCVVLDEAVYDVVFGTTAPSTYAGGDTSGTTTLLSRVVGTIASGTHNAQSGDSYARLGAPAGASVSADVAAVKAQTAAIETDTQDLQTQVGTDGAGLTNIPWNAAWDAEVQSEATDALNAYDPPTNTEMAAAFTEIKGATWSSTTDTLEHIRDKQTDIETDTQDLQTQIGTDGAGLTAIGDTRLANLDAAVSSRLATAGYTAPLDAAGTRTALGMSTNNLDTQLAALPTDADVQTAAAAALTAYDPPTKAELDSGLAGLNDPTAAAIADAVWDEAIAGHAGVGSTGEALTAAGSAGDPWATALPGAYGSGTAGKIIGDNINATVSSRASQTSVDDLPTNAELASALASADDATLAAIGALNNLSSAQAQTAAAAALTAYDPPTKAELDSAVAPLATAAALATVDGIVDDILEDTGTTLPGSLTTISGYLDTEVAAILAAVDTEVAAIKAKTDNLPAAPAATGDIPTAAAIRAEIDANSTQLAAIVADTNELQTDWADGGRLDLILDNAGAAATPPTVEEIRAEIDSNSTQLAAIVADTNELQTNQGNWLTADVSGLAQTGADGDTLETLSDQIDLLSSAAGSGAVAYSITVQDESNDPIDGVEVWITTDSAGSNVVAGTLTTDAMGLVIFMLDAGDYYVWRQASGYNFTNPVAITVS